MKTVKTQNQAIETYLRGTGRTLTAAQAAARFGIKNLRARMFELRGAGLNVRTDVASSTGKAKYYIPVRDVLGSKAKIFK
jgi:hypothetical protein